MSPTTLLAVLVATLAAFVGFFALLLNVMQRTARRDADEAVAGLRKLTLELFEAVEALKGRHRQLAGPGVAPSGDTERAAADALRHIDEAADAWTSLTQKLDQATRLMDEEGKWGRRLLDEARDLALDKENEKTAARARAAAAEATKLLDRLEEAPRRALAALEQARAMGLVEPGMGAIEERIRSDPVRAADEAEKLAGRRERA
jgi:hypothetical protein